MHEMLRLRELGQCDGGRGGGMTAAQRCHVTAFGALPLRLTRTIDEISGRAYIGQFSKSGNIFTGVPLPGPAGFFRVCSTNEAYSGARIGQLPEAGDIFTNALLPGFARFCTRRQ
jgi:hypothetical protein